MNAFCRAMPDNWKWDTKRKRWVLRKHVLEKAASKPRRRPNRWPALKRRIESDLPRLNRRCGGTPFTVAEQSAYAREAIRRLTRWGCKVTLPRS